jgi:hypothetical protein
MAFRTLALVLAGCMATVATQVQAQTTLEGRTASVPTTFNEDNDGIRVGGAVRLNYAWRDYDAQNRDRLGDFELELFRVDVVGTIGRVMLDAQYRWYNDFEAIHHAWFGYQFTEDVHAELGITQVPFGILPWASHSFWFGGTYYLGFEDDYDTGLKLVQRRGPWTFHYAFFKNPEYSDDSRYGRYSFDLVTGGDQQNSETNQINLRGERRLTHGERSFTDVGMSLQLGQMYNRETRSSGHRNAAAVHADGHYGAYHLQLQWIRYAYSPRNPPGVSDDFVQLGAFNFPFMVAAEADVVSLNIARAIDLNVSPITGATCYNNLTVIAPRVEDSASSVQNVTGCSVAAGGLFTYIDYVVGRNMWFAGGPGVGLSGPEAGEWHSRLNINFGFYF